MEQKIISEELAVELRRLTVNGHIRMAGIVLKTYLIRCWKLEEVVAQQLMKRYFQKHFPTQLEKHLKRTS